ncbi:MAG: glutamate-5-semialdehyde dehydrogenase [Rhodothermales bacterium]|nr:glutamate-5-semialdehyde dehydrogenase [Rhodothermales bacterium]MBO6778704.1 glutamate-5-semialdehyde dehydrogenase [Rhodothermales bacterium]
MSVDLELMGRQARAASRVLARLTGDERAASVRAMAKGLRAASKEILEANQADCAAAEGVLGAALMDRLRLDAPRLEMLAADVDRVADIPDPVGKVMDRRELESGLDLSRVRVPLGVVGVIYEARPNVTVDIAALCMRTGNASILRGGKETLLTNRALVRVIRQALRDAGVSADAVQFVDSTDRAYVQDLLRLDRFVDMIIPRGGAGLHRLCVEAGTIPVITGGIGICHAFVDETADLDKAFAVIHNAKTQRPSVCNALDTVLVHRGIADDFLPRLPGRLPGVSLHASPAAAHWLPQAEEVKDGDFDREWLSLSLSVHVVEGLEDALDHIDCHSSGHSDCILTQSAENAERFVAEVDSAAVYVNASTRFTDGGQFGLGAEVAVSTQKLHARGPMGLEALTTYKWVGRGDWLVRV